MKQNIIFCNLVLVKKKCYVMFDHPEMMRRKAHKGYFQPVKLKKNYKNRKLWG